MRRFPCLPKNCLPKNWKIFAVFHTKSFSYKKKIRFSYKKFSIQKKFFIQKVFHTKSFSYKKCGFSYKKFSIQKMRFFIQKKRSGFHTKSFPYKNFRFSIQKEFHTKKVKKIVFFCMKTCFLYEILFVWKTIFFCMELFLYGKLFVWKPGCPVLMGQ